MTSKSRVEQSRGQKPVWQGSKSSQMSSETSEAEVSITTSEMIGTKEKKRKQELYEYTILV